MQKCEKAKYSMLNNLCYLLKGIWNSDRKLFHLMILEALCAVITPYIAMYLPKIGVDLVSDHVSVQKAFLYIGGLTVIMTVSQMLVSMANRGKTIRVNRLRSYYRIQLFGKTLDCDYGHVEDPKWQDKYVQAKLMSVDWGPWSATTLMTESAVKVCSAVLSFFLYSSIIALVNSWLLLLLIVLSGVNFLAVHLAKEREVARMMERSSIQRRVWYMSDQAGDTRLGKDLRLFEMTDWIKSHYHYHRRAYLELRRQVSQYYYHAALVEAVTLFLRDGVAWIYFLWEAANGRLSPGEFVLSCNAVASFSELVTEVTDSIGKMAQSVPPLNRMRAYLESMDDPEPDSAADLPVAGKPISIEFRDVCFSYDKKTTILSHFNLCMDPGEKIALVGINGAGKTTLVKLLCGFYQVDSGEILINGVDISHYRKSDLYNLLAPVFQEATILPFTILENVSLQEAQKTDRVRVEECLRKVGLLETVQAFPFGLNTVLMRLKEGTGGWLSGGQQQKLLMARALYKDSPLLFFDEPTAALDPIAESDIYEQFHKLSENKTVLYISHRLAGIKFCDRVVFLEEGRVVAYGSHEDLMKCCNSYAKMYEVQSHYYKRDVEAVF